MLFLEEHQHKLLVVAVAFVLYTFSRMEFNDMAGMMFHFLLNALVFVFVSKAVVTFAEKVMMDRRKKTV